MTEEKEGILKLIRNSFLDEKDKILLEKEIENKGVNENFFFLMKELMIREIKKRGIKYIDFIKKIDKQFNNLNENLETKKEELESTLNSDLSQINTSDISIRNKIFNKYYQEIDNLNNYHDNNMKKLFTKLYTEIMFS